MAPVHTVHFRHTQAFVATRTMPGKGGVVAVAFETRRPLFLLAVGLRIVGYDRDVELTTLDNFSVDVERGAVEETPHGGNLRIAMEIPGSMLQEPRLFKFPQHARIEVGDRWGGRFGVRLRYLPPEGVTHTCDAKVSLYGVASEPADQL